VGGGREEEGREDIDRVGEPDMVEVECGPSNITVWPEFLFACTVSECPP
jgi:hypothetical protein